MRARWQGIARDLDANFRAVQSYEIRLSWKTEVRDALRRIFDGGAFRPILEGAQAVHKRILRGRVFVALHMHAGDGNVHTNIPVNSDDYVMLQRATQAVARIMALARSLGGVISGEHGIGITKLEFLTEAELAPFADYKRRIDPEGRFNKGKLLRELLNFGRITRPPQMCGHIYLIDLDRYGCHQHGIRPVHRGKLQNLYCNAVVFQALGYR